MKAELPMEYHAARVMQKAEFGKKSRRDSAFDVPASLEELIYVALTTATVRQDHDHQFTCTKGSNGKTGCRMCIPRAHPIVETILVTSARDTDPDPH